MAAGLLGDPLSTVPQQALLAVAIAAAVLAITGFCVSIAAGIRQRRAENALLAALGVPPRAAAGQLCLEKLMLSLPAAVAGLILGVVLAELLVPAITLTSSASTPVPPVIIQFGWAPTLPLALAVAVLPVLAAALTLARRPDAAAAAARRGGGMSPGVTAAAEAVPGRRRAPARSRWRCSSPGASSPRWPGPRSACTPGPRRSARPWASWPRRSRPSRSARALNDIAQPGAAHLTAPALTSSQLNLLTQQITASLAGLPLPLAASAWHA